VNQRLALSKILAVALSAGICGLLLIGLPLSVNAGTEIETIYFSSIIGMVAAIFGVVVGFPAILIVDAVLPHAKFRHVALGAFCAVLAWLIVEGAFARDAWNNIWASSTFWIERAPRRLAVFAVIGLLAGILYSLIWPSLLRKRTAAKDR
jgi:uncharacterized protein YacL